MDENKWLKVTIRTNPILVESISDFLVGIIEAGVETGARDELLYGTVNGYIKKANLSRYEKDDIIQKITVYLAELAKVFDVAMPTLSTSIIEEEDWGKSWKEHFKPFAIVPGLVIAPTWAPSPESGESVITMDPGMAFGTGHHATTSLCLECIRETLTGTTGIRLLDVGTGTGILGMAALLFGAERVLAIDNDREAVRVAEKNVGMNLLGERMGVSLTPLSSLVKPYEVVVANIVHDVLVDMADDLVRLTLEGGTLILSGILAGTQVDNIQTVFIGRGFRLLSQKRRQEWAALRFRKG